MRISPHFTLEEMTFSQTAARRGIDNTPPRHIIANLRRTCGLLEQIRTLFGKPIYISSGYRSLELNRAIGGSANSAHTHGLAVDFTIRGFTPYEICTRIRDADFDFDQLILEYDSWVHIGLGRTKNRKECLTVRRDIGYMFGIIQKE